MIAFFYDLFYMLPLGIALILSALGTGLGDMILGTGADGGGIPAAAGVVISSLFIMLILVLRHSGKRERILIGGILTAAIVSLYLILGEEKRELIYNRYSWILIVLILAVIAIVLGKLAQDLTALKIVIVVILFAGIMYIMLDKRQCPFGTVGFCLAVIMIYTMEIIQRYWKKSGYTEVKSHVAHIAPILLVLCITVSLIPTPEERFDWSLVKDLWKATVTEYKRFVAMITTDDDEYGYAGFSEDGSVKSGVSDSSREVMHISFGKNNYDRLYMGGIIYDNFNGHGWDTELKDKVNDREMDFIETKVAVAHYDQGYEGEYIKSDVISVESRLYNTKHIFIPSKTNMQNRNTVIPKYKETESKIIADSKIRFGDTYDIEYVYMNYDNPDLIELIDNAEALDKDIWDDTLRKNGLASNDDNSYENYIKYRSSIYEKYGGDESLTMEEALEKSSMSQELKDIISDAMDNAISDNGEGNAGEYEKLMAVAQYLQTLNYTKNPGVLPAEINDAYDYLNYFILNSQSGYCVHYATAFTLLARELGFPARYVQGYYVKKNKTGEKLVTENNAHAWAEVYFDNVGWIIFESTPGYAISKGWAVNGKATRQYDMQFDTSIYAKQSNVVDGASSELDKLPQEEKKQVNILYFVIPVVCAIVFGILFLFISRILADKRYQRMSNSEKVLDLINRNMRILRIMGYTLGECETLDEYRKTKREDVSLEELSFLGLYERMLYSEYQASEEDVNCIEEEYAVLKQNLREKGIRYKFYLV